MAKPNIYNQNHIYFSYYINKSNGDLKKLIKKKC